MRLLAEVGAIVRKDLVTELRSGEILLSMVLFSGLVVLVFAFAFVRDGAPVPDVAAGILWVSLAFAGTLGLSRAWDREREADGLRAMLLSPASRTAIYLAKVVVIFFFLSATAVAVVPLVGLMFNVPLLAHGGRLLLLLALGLLGFSLLGAFFGALMARNRARDLMLFIVLYPLLFPLFICGVMGTAQVFSPEPSHAHLELFTAVLVLFDVVMAVVSLWTFEKLIVE
jgi:heme exporter protein B